RKRLRAYWQDWKAKNREHYLEWRRRWKKKNLEKVRETNRRWWSSVSRAKKARRQKKHTIRLRKLKSAETPVNSE
ncbi:MAG: hypothetical protein A2Z03_00720, partial [Chloroflexi bacterium RBG_16_56_8]